MKLSRKWLSEFVDVDASDKEFAEAMTISGSKVEITEDLGAEISNVVAGRIKAMERHPDSDHMWVCQVDVGKDELVQIVTGAWNIHEGDLVPVALHKSTLPGGKKIEKGKLRGVLSNGMLCSLKELGLDERDFPYGVITAAALLNDYKPLDPEKPSVPQGVTPGYKIFGSVKAAFVTKVENLGDGRFTVNCDSGGLYHTITTTLSNIHVHDTLALDTEKEHICTLADLSAQQAEFPHCISDGIFVMQEDCKPGDDIRPVVGLDDHVVEFEITPNRPDCLSVIGLAREVSATYNKPLRLHEPAVKGCPEDAENPLARTLPELLDVETPAASLVPRYTARMVRNVKIAPSPKWMRERLRAMGVRPINNIVDITNYVMLEYGQPMHAFDYRYVKGGKIIVRLAEEGEELTTLDGNVRKLTANHLVIADETRAVGLAGIMGGENSEIVDDTSYVVFESACFDGTCIRKGAVALGMRTEASAKFEKGLDPMNTLPAVNRACELVELLGAGEVVDGVIDILNHVPQPTILKLDPDKINTLLGTDVAENVMYTFLQRLGFETTKERGMIQVPSWRSDVQGMADLAEEVARFYGYNNLPMTLMRGDTTRGGFSPRQKLENKVGDLCRALGYSEILTYSFISPAYYDKIRLPEDSPKRKSVTILNPLGEDTSIMRTTALPSLLEILARNYSYRNPSAQLYELARTYHPVEGQDLADERQMLSLGGYGPSMDFFTLKGAVETVLKGLNVSYSGFRAKTDVPAFHPGRCAVVYAGDVELGTLGQLHPLTCANYGVDVPMYAAQLDFSLLLEHQAPEALYQPLPRFPSVTRDIAVVCDSTIPVARLEECIVRGAKGLLKELELFDIYTGSPIPDGKKSVAFNLYLRAEDRSLTAAEADEDVKHILAQLESELGAVLR
ncbi:MAG: phenylalanine--tRNA ligase subunit beta [Oscillospiraceae bacterium]|nr:phenylalanine--tRNA ligase subunit beta [Oscillospiraceae bacterium]